jgi:ribosomal protein S18 acetylase RimI-like enzyme
VASDTAPGSERGVSIRTAAVTDVDSVLTLWRLAETAPSTTDDASALNLLTDTNPDTLLVAEDNDTIVGTLIVAFDGWRGNMYRLAILPEYRRRGHARHLVDEGERRLRQRGVRRITALVAHEQPGATQFWEAVGYNLDRYTVRHVKTL